jgi:hypothetical protein
MVDPSLMEMYPDQSHTFMGMGVLIAMHGAALTNQFWMRPHRGAVVEIGMAGNYHYANMAANLGHKYIFLSSRDITGITQAAVAAMDHVSSRYA